MSRFRMINTLTGDLTSPVTMYADYKNRRIASLYAHQEKILKEYVSCGIDKPDISLELPTGSGKTLVGLLIGEFRRRARGERVVYLCVNNLLVNQVCNCARDLYGIDARPFTGSARDYPPSDKDAYQSAECIAVTSYSAVFNSSPFFSNAHIIICDDAHSAGDYVASNWCMRIPHGVGLYGILVDLFRPYVDDTTYHRLLTGSRGASDFGWAGILPARSQQSLETQMEAAVNSFLDSNPESELRYPWRQLRGHLSSCNVYYTQEAICIRPFVPPTMTFSPFSDARQRVYMSATLGNSGELERAFGIERIYQLPPVAEWEGRTTGRRFFMFPTVSLGEMPKDEILLSLLGCSDKALVLVDSKATETELVSMLREKSGKVVFTADDLKQSKAPFTSVDSAVAVLANRVDGIDFPDDECRLMFVYELPRAMDVQERFFVGSVGARRLYSERRKARLVQAFGRCTRSQTDYAAVCLLSDRLSADFLAPSETVLLNAELRAELQFGHENARGLANVQAYGELLGAFFEHGEEWDEAESSIINHRLALVSQPPSAEQLEPVRQLYDSSLHEVAASYAIWRGDYDLAFREARQAALFQTHPELSGYASYWFYVAACQADMVAYALSDENYAKERDSCFDSARKAARYTPWLSTRHAPVAEASSNGGNERVVQRLEKRLARKLSRSANKKMVLDELDDLASNLETEDGNEFERWHCELGEWLGYYATNPKGNAEPDPIWIVDETLCIVAEDKRREGTRVSVDNVRQAAGHEKWVRAKAAEGGLPLDEDARCVTIFVTLAEEIDYNAKLHADGIFYVNHLKFLEWAKTAISVLKRAIQRFDAPDNAQWRNELVADLMANRADSGSFLDMATSKKLVDLPSG